MSIEKSSEIAVGSVPPDIATITRELGPNSDYFPPGGNSYSDWPELHFDLEYYFVECKQK